MDSEQKAHYEHLLDLKPVEPTAQELAEKPYRQAAMPALPKTLVRLHERYEGFFRRMYNRGLERGQLPLIAAIALELDPGKEPATLPTPVGSAAKKRVA